VCVCVCISVCVCVHLCLCVFVYIDQVVVITEQQYEVKTGTTIVCKTAVKDMVLLLVSVCMLWWHVWLYIKI